MCRLFETIKVQNGELFNLDLHSNRMNSARRELMGLDDKIELQAVLKVPAEACEGLFKCRVEYDAEITKIEWIRYEPRIINRLKLIECGKISYEHKYSDRTIFMRLLRENNCSADEDILIVRNGIITDTSFSNIAFYDGESWYTPMNNLLRGTKREELIRKKILSEKEIQRKDLDNYIRFKLINAMIDFNAGPSYTMDQITE